MKIKNAINKAIKVEWRKEDKPVLEESPNHLWVRFEREENQKSLPVMYLSDILLDPKFFQALGKSEGWSTEMKMRAKPITVQVFSIEYKYRMHVFIFNLGQGQEIETAFDDATK